MLTDVVAQLKTGTITAVVPFGSDGTPAAPYIVVREDRDPLDRGWAYHVIVHMRPGQQLFLHQYVVNDLAQLLDRKLILCANGNRMKLESTGEITGIVTGNDDGTISMERVFLEPSRLF